MLQEKIKKLEQSIQQSYGNTTGLLVRKDGRTLYEGYFNGFAAENAGHVYSVTKSVFSILIGIAIDLGRIKSLDETVLSFFPDYAVKPGETSIQNITIRHLLTMTAPYRYDTEPYEEFFTSPNPITTALDYLGGEAPIGKFRYSAIGGTHILSGILARATGTSTFDFATERLFAPLGINVPRNIILHSAEEHFAVMNDKTTRGWVVDPQGSNMASWGLFLTPDEMAKIGQLYLNSGNWNGEQIVSREWIAESTQEQSRCVEWGNLGYGYLWWIIDAESYAALGDGGNVIYVNHKNNMVIALAAQFMPNAADRIGWIKQMIEPMFEND